MSSKDARHNLSASFKQPTKKLKQGLCLTHLQSEQGSLFPKEDPPGLLLGGVAGAGRQMGPNCSQGLVSHLQHALVIQVHLHWTLQLGMAPDPEFVYFHGRWMSQSLLWNKKFINCYVLRRTVFSLLLMISSLSDSPLLHPRGLYTDQVVLPWIGSLVSIMSFCLTVLWVIIILILEM